MHTPKLRHPIMAYVGRASFVCGVLSLGLIAMLPLAESAPGLFRLMQFLPAVGLMLGLASLKTPGGQAGSLLNGLMGLWVVWCYVYLHHGISLAPF
jgi:hypothetical protein